MARPPAASSTVSFPARTIADVVSYDNYRTLDDRYYHEILTIANGKPIAFGEVGSSAAAGSSASPAEVGVLHDLGSGGHGEGGGGGRGAAQPTPTPVNIPPNATAQQLRQIIQDLQQQAAGGGRGGRGATAYPIPEGASTDMLRRIIQRIQPGGNALKAIYDDPYYIKRGDPLPK